MSRQWYCQRYKEIKSIEDLSKGFSGTGKNFNDQFNQLISLDHFSGAGKEWTIIKSLQGKSLEAGMIVLAKYNCCNCGVDIYKIHGVTDCKNKYGDGEDIFALSFKSVKEVLKKYEAKTLEELHQKQHEFMKSQGVADVYGHDSHLYIEDLSTGEHGAWYYISDNKWCRGSGAEPLSFILLKEYVFSDSEMEIKREAGIKDALENSASLSASFSKVE